MLVGIFWPVKKNWLIGVSHYTLMSQDTRLSKLKSSVEITDAFIISIVARLGNKKSTSIMQVGGLTLLQIVSDIYCNMCFTRW